MLDAQKERSFLLVLEASSYNELARAKETPTKAVNPCPCQYQSLQRHDTILRTPRIVLHDDIDPPIGPKAGGSYYEDYRRQHDIMQQLPGLALRVLGIFSLSAVFAAVVAETREIGPGEDLQLAVDALNPGEELVLHAGTYVLPSRLSIYQKQAIVIRANDVNPRPVIKYPTNDQNVIEVEDSRDIALRGLEVTGGSHGIRLYNSSFITVEDCHIHHTGDVALSANRPNDTYEHLVIRHNHIRYTDGAGAGIALGCNQDACRVFDSLVEGNYIHHTDGPNVTQGTGIGIGEGSYQNTVRDNVIHDTKAYPCIITDSTRGKGGPNVIERNFLWDCHDHGIQATADAVIRNNIILRASWDGIRSHPHENGTPSNLEITHNTILAPTNNAIRIDRMTGPVVIANNALFAEVGNAIEINEGDTTQLTVTGNIGSGGTIGIPEGGFDGNASIAIDLQAASYGALPQNVFPSEVSALRDMAVPVSAVADDFDTTPRDGAPDVGAYEWQPGGNPGWTLAETFKQIVSRVNAQ